MSAIGREVYAPYFRALLAEALGQVGQAEDGLDLLDEALAFIDKTGERFWEAEVYRLKGELLLTRSKKNRAAADAAFNQAITIARRQEAKLLELRATTSLARLWGERNKRAQAQTCVMTRLSKTGSRWRAALWRACRRNSPIRQGRGRGNCFKHQNGLVIDTSET